MATLAASRRETPPLASITRLNVLNDDDWRHLKTYLVRQTSENQSVSLQVTGHVPRRRPEVVNEIQDLVEEFTFRRIREVREYG